MSRPRTLDECLAAARPPDPAGRESDAIAVRVLARAATISSASSAECADREHAAPPSSPKGRRARRLIAASGLVVALAIVGVGIGMIASTRGSNEPGDPSTSVARADGRESAPPALSPAFAPVPSEASTAAASIGARESATEPAAMQGSASASSPDPLGPAARERSLARAEAGGADAADALRALSRVGGPAGMSEARRVAALHAAASLSSVVREVLVSAPGDAGATALADLLLARTGAGVAARDADAEGERAIVLALESVADGGREALAMAGLRRAADAGSFEAALACLRRGGSADLGRALEAARASSRSSVNGANGTTATDIERLAEIVRAQPKTLGAALERRVLHGDSTALVVATMARFEWVVDALRPRLADAAGGFIAVEAVQSIALIGGSVAWEALASVVETPGPLGRAASDAIALLPPEAADTFAVMAAREAGTRAAPSLVALAAMGDVGLVRLRALAERPALAATVVRALAASSSPRASDALASLGGRPGLALPVVESLSARLSRGDAAASDALLVMARDVASPAARAALDALAASGAAGRASLAAALADPKLRPAASAALRREESASGASASDGGAARGATAGGLPARAGPRVPEPLPPPAVKPAPTGAPLSPGSTPGAPRTRAGR